MRFSLSSRERVHSAFPLATLPRWYRYIRACTRPSPMQRILRRVVVLGSISTTIASMQLNVPISLAKFLIPRHPTSPFSHEVFTICEWFSLLAQGVQFPLSARLCDCLIIVKVAEIGEVFQKQRTPSFMANYVRNTIRGIKKGPFAQIAFSILANRIVLCFLNVHNMAPTILLWRKKTQVWEGRLTVLK